MSLCRFSFRLAVGEMSVMDISNVLLQLRGERDRIAQAIAVLEQLAHGRKRGPGRPPGSLTVSRRVPESRSGTDGRTGKPPDANQATQ
jgi:hypothetical protein